MSENRSTPPLINEDPVGRVTAWTMLIALLLTVGFYLMLACWTLNAVSFVVGGMAFWIALTPAFLRLVFVRPRPGPNWPEFVFVWIGAAVAGFALATVVVATSFMTLVGVNLVVVLMAKVIGFESPFGVALATGWLAASTVFGFCTHHLVAQALRAAP